MKYDHSQMQSTASVTIDKARLFLAQARMADPDDRAIVSANLEAAIVFSRSVTFHLQSQFAHHAGFEDWYAQQQSFLRSHRLCRFLMEQRNHVLKAGPIVAHRNVHVAITEVVSARDELSAQVIRGQPWWRRSLKVLVEDALYPWRQRYRMWRDLRQVREAVETGADDSTSVILSDELHFDGDEWKGTPALELVERYLDILSHIVADAEVCFRVPHGAKAGGATSHLL